MIVRCLDSSFGPCEGRTELAAFLGGAGASFASHHLPLEVGMDYLVAAVAFGPSVPWFFVLDHSPGLRAPIIAPCLLFDVKDSRLSRSWESGVWVDRFERRHGLLAPACWAKDTLFHGRVFEGEAEAVRQMDGVASSLLLEFPLPWITAIAVPVGHGHWVADRDWSNTWEADPTQAMTVNPSTGALFHNPLFAEPG
jgi:hypothetical protein